MKTSKQLIAIGLITLTAVTGIMTVNSKGLNEASAINSQENTNIVIESAEAPIELNRKVDIEGTINMRDLGGLKTSTGKTIKSGLIFRSENLHGLTEKGQDDFEKLGIQTVIDFRGENEILQHPDKLPENVVSINIPVTDPADLDELIPAELQKEIRAALINRDYTKAQNLLESNNIDLKELKKSRYVQFPSIWNEQFASFLDQVLKADGTPLLFHCEGGKDRAGFAAAMLLRTLDVPVEVVLDDFILTNEYSKSKNEVMMQEWPEELHPVLLADLSDLQAALDYIDQNYEDFDHYRRDVLKITDQEKEQLKKLLLY